MEELEDTMPLDWEEPQVGKNKDQLAGYLIFSNGSRHKIYYKENIIGRDPNSHVVITDRPISSKHAVIIAEDKESHFLLDLGSLNKTKIGKVYLKPKVRYFIRDGDELHFGNVRATYSYAYESETLVENLNNMTIPETPEKHDEIICETPVKGSNYGPELKALISEFSQRRKIFTPENEETVQGCPSIFEIATQSVEDDPQIYDLETERYSEKTSKNYSDIFAMETVKFSETDEKAQNKKENIFDVETEKISRDKQVTDQETEDVNLNPEKNELNTSLEDLFASQDVFESEGCKEKNDHENLNKSKVDSNHLEIPSEKNVMPTLPSNENNDFVQSSQISNQSCDIPLIPNFLESCGYNDHLIDMCLPTTEKSAESSAMKKSFEGFESEQTSSEIKAILDLKRVTNKLSLEVDNSVQTIPSKVEEVNPVEECLKQTDKTCAIQIQEGTALRFSPSQKLEETINLTVQGNSIEDATACNSVSNEAQTETEKVNQPISDDRSNKVDVNIPPLDESQSLTPEINYGVQKGEILGDGQEPLGSKEKPVSAEESLTHHSVTLDNEDSNHHLFKEKYISSPVSCAILPDQGIGATIHEDTVVESLHPITIEKADEKTIDINPSNQEMEHEITVANHEDVIEIAEISSPLHSDDISLHAQGKPTNDFANLEDITGLIPLENKEKTVIAKSTPEINSCDPEITVANESVTLDITSPLKSNSMLEDKARPTIDATTLEDITELFPSEEKDIARSTVVINSSNTEIIMGNGTVTAETSSPLTEISPEDKGSSMVEVTNIQDIAELFPLVSKEKSDIVKSPSEITSINTEITVANREHNISELSAKELKENPSPDNTYPASSDKGRLTELEDMANLLPLVNEEKSNITEGAAKFNSSNEGDILENDIPITEHHIDHASPLINELGNDAKTTTASFEDDINVLEPIDKENDHPILQESLAAKNSNAQYGSPNMDKESNEIPSCGVIENLNFDQKSEDYHQYHDESIANTEKCQKLASCNEIEDSSSANDHCNVETSDSAVKDDTFENVADLSTQVISYPKFQEVLIKPVIIIDKSSLSDKQEIPETIDAPTPDDRNLAELATQIVDYDILKNQKKPIIIDNRKNNDIDLENIAEMATQVIINNQASPVPAEKSSQDVEVPSTPIIKKEKKSFTSPGFEGFKVLDSGKKSKRKLLRKKLDEFVSFKEPVAQKQVMNSTGTEEENIAELATQVVDYQSIASTSKTSVFDGFNMQGSGKKFKRKSFHDKLEERSILDMQTQEMIICRRDSDEFDTQTVDNVEKEMLDMFQQENHIEKEDPNSTQVVLDQLLSPDLAISELCTQAVNLDQINHDDCKIKINATAGSRVEKEMLDIFGQENLSEKIPCKNSTQAVIDQLETQISDLSTQVVNLDQIQKDPVKNCEIRVKNKDSEIINVAEVFSDPPSSTPIKIENTRMRTRNQGKKKEEIKEDGKKSLYKKEKKPKTIEKKTLKVKIEKPSLPEKLSVKTSEKLSAKLSEKPEIIEKTQISSPKKVFFDLPKDDDDLPSKKPRVFTISDDEDSFEITKPEKTLGTSVFSKTFSLGIFSRKRQIKVENSPNASSYSLLSMDETLTDSPICKLSKISEVSDEDSKTPKKNVSFSKKVVKLENSPNTSSYSLINMDETCNEVKTPVTKKDEVKTPVSKNDTKGKTPVAKNDTKGKTPVSKDDTKGKTPVAKNNTKVKTPVSKRDNAIITPVTANEEKSETKPESLGNLGKGKRTRTRKVYSDYETEPQNLNNVIKKLENETSTKKIIKNDKKSNNKRKEADDLPKSGPSSEDNKRKRKIKDDEIEEINKKRKATESSSTSQRRTRQRNNQSTENIISEERRSSRSNKRV